jgi:hypothetical protein
VREPRQVAREPATSRGFISNPKSAWPDSILKKPMGPEPLTFSGRDLTNILLHAKVKKRDPDMGNGWLHAMLVIFRFGVSIMYNIIWARRLSYLCTIDVRVDIMHVGCSEKLARSWMSSTTMYFCSRTWEIVASLRLDHRILP